MMLKRATKNSEVIAAAAAAEEDEASQASYRSFGFARTSAHSLHVFGGFHVKPRPCVDKAQMVVNFLDAGGIFSRDNRSPARTVVDNETVQVNDAITYGDLQPDRKPIGGFQRPDNTVADVVVICGRIGYLPGHA